MQRDAPAHLVREGELRELVHEELRRVLDAERQRHLLHVVVEVDARRAPHDDLARAIALEQLHRARRHARACCHVALPVVHDAAAVGRPPDRDVVEPEAVEHRGHRLDHVDGAQHVAAEVEDDLVRRGSRSGPPEPPGPLVGQGHEVVGQLHLAEMLAVVVATGAILPRREEPVMDVGNANHLSCSTPRGSSPRRADFVPSRPEA